MFRIVLRALNRCGVDETSLFEEMYTRICEENGPADPVLQGIVSNWRVLADLVGSDDGAVGFSGC
jgi:hypothetical protein